MVNSQEDDDTGGDVMKIDRMQLQSQIREDVGSTMKVTLKFNKHLPVSMNFTHTDEAYVITLNTSKIRSDNRFNEIMRSIYRSLDLQWEGIRGTIKVEALIPEPKKIKRIRRK